MSALPVLRDRRAERYAATRREILDAAWDLVRANGLGALAMRDLGARVGMRAQSLYGYFPSKFAIYDAMFAESNLELLRRVNDLTAARDPIEALRGRTRMFMAFCVEDPGRYQLLFQRTIPGFEPSPEAYAPAMDVLESAGEALRACGIGDPRAVDMWTAIIAGLTAQQTSNQPGGDRWVRLADEATDMFLAHYAPTKKRGKQ
ncbi:MAG: TetR/AcrR family transcriptional regulator [Candidatus Dormiibacterota bacterium]